jgi:hypothetical protein
MILEIERVEVEFYGKYPIYLILTVGDTIYGTDYDLIEYLEIDSDEYRLKAMWYDTREDDIDFIKLGFPSIYFKKEEECRKFIERYLMKKLIN